MRKQLLSLLKRLCAPSPLPWSDSLSVGADALVRRAQDEARRFNHTLIDIEHLALAFARSYFPERCASIGSRLAAGPDSVIIGRLPYSEAFARFLDYVIGTAPARLIQVGDLWSGLFSCPFDEIRRSVGRLGLDEQWFKSS